MKAVKTKFGSIDSFEKGNIDIVQGSSKDYAFSNLFEVAKNAQPFKRIAIAKNFEYIVEVIKIEGTSNWFLCPHDEFCVVMCGEVEASFIKPEFINKSNKQGARLLDTKPEGQYMGKIIANQGHMLLLARDRAYCLNSSKPSVIIVQTLLGEQTIEKWGDICSLNEKEHCDVK